MAAVWEPGSGWGWGLWTCHIFDAAFSYTPKHCYVRIGSLKLVNRDPGASHE